MKVGNTARHALGAIIQPFLPPLEIRLVFRSPWDLLHPDSSTALRSLASGKPTP